MESTMLPQIRILTEKLIFVEGQLEKFFDLSLDLFAISGKTNLIRVNNSWNKILGWDDSQLLSHPWSEFIHPDDLDKSNYAAEVLMQTGDIVDFTNRIKKSDGCYVQVSWRATKWDEQGISYSVGRPDIFCVQKNRRVGDKR